jgi:hypothetical protein
MKNLV